MSAHDSWIIVIASLATVIAISGITVMLSNIAQSQKQSADALLSIATRLEFIANYLLQIRNKI